MINIEINGKTYEVDLATTEKEREEGLQGVESLENGEGMLFVYDEPQEVSFWMSETPLYLDIIFIDEDGDVISTAVGQPNDETPMTEENVKYVLEINVNSGIKKGDEVDLSELEDDEDDEEEEDEEEEDEKAITMNVLNEDGSVQMKLEGGERIFSRNHTKRLISLAKRAKRSKNDSDYMRLGKAVFSFIYKQNTQKQDYVQLEKDEEE